MLEDPPGPLHHNQRRHTLPDPLFLLDRPRTFIAFFLTLFLCTLFLVSSGSNNDNNKIKTTAVMVRVRLAKPADVDKITKVVLQAMPFDPQWDYRFRYRLKFPDDHYKYTRMLYEQFADPANDDWRLLVVELDPEEKRQQGFIKWIPSLTKWRPGLPATTTERSEIVAFSVWNVSYINKKKYGSSYQPQNPMLYVAKHGGSTRRDVDPARQKAFRGSDVDSEKLFAKYGNDRIILQILGTHPDHWRHGYATSLCQYGMQIAADEGLVLTLVAGKTGVGLYKHLNFTSLGEVVKQVSGEEEKVVSEAMVFDPKTQAVSNL